MALNTVAGVVAPIWGTYPLPLVDRESESVTFGLEKKIGSQYSSDPEGEHRHQKSLSSHNDNESVAALERKLSGRQDPKKTTKAQHSKPRSRHGLGETQKGDCLCSGEKQ